MKNKNGKILRVDLSSMSFSEEDSGRYNERFLVVVELVPGFYLMSLIEKRIL